MKVKIAEKGYASFTGSLGNIQFEDAVSVGHVDFDEAMRLGGYMRIVEVDEVGNEIGPVSYAAEIARTRNLTTKVVAPLERGDPNAPSPDAAEQNGLSAPAPDPVPEPEVASDEPLPIYTRDELEAIADDKGIRGLREIGNALKVRNNSIPGLIDEILAAQTSNQKA